MYEVIKILEQKKVLVESQGSKDVMLGENEASCIIVKSNVYTILLLTIKFIILKKVFEVAKYIVNEKYTKDLVHVSYGMVNLKTGKCQQEKVLLYIYNNYQRML